MNNSSNKNLAKHMWDRQKDASVEAEERPPQGHVVQWDQFLPFRSLKVLLVENDDSTRQLVGALLRNCGYEVVAVRNGKEAWEIIEDQTNNINLVLTEVVTPCLPGVDLLSKIKRHKTSNHIPVIMMSSNDCMSTVIECLSKGAVDFLVKPIRKNELKNLWQHVWRKCGTQTRPEAISGEDEFDHVGMDQDLHIGILKSPHIHLDDANEKVPESVVNKERLELENVTNYQIADKIPDDPSEKHKTEDRRGVVYDEQRQRVEGDFTLRQSGLSAFTRYSTSTNNQALVGNKEEDGTHSTNNYIFAEPEAENYNLKHNTSKVAHQQVQVHHHHHHHHVHNNHDELLTGVNEQNSTTYSFSGSGNINGSGSSNNAAGGSGGPHQNLQLTQREIALNKFREKRKNRCFDKKV